MGEREKAYRRRIRAWTLYDWANSAFATTILAAVLPVYYRQVAGSTLPSPSVATAYWTTGLSLSIFLGALLAPVLGTLSDIIRGKKLFLALFAGLGVVCTGLLVLVKSGDWLLASLLFVFGRLGFGSSLRLLRRAAAARGPARGPGLGLRPRVRPGLPGRRAAAGRQRGDDPPAARNLGAAPVLRQRGLVVGPVQHPGAGRGAGAAHPERPSQRAGVAERPLSGAWPRRCAAGEATGSCSSTCWPTWCTPAGSAPSSPWRPSSARSWAWAAWS